MHLGGALQRGAGEEALSLQLSAPGEHRVHARQRPRGEHAVERRDLRVEDARREEHVLPPAREQRVERAPRVEPDDRGDAAEDPEADLLPDRCFTRALARTHQLGQARALVHRRADVEAVQRERLAQLGPHQLRQRAAGGAPQDLAHQPAVGDAVVAALAAARRARGRARGERGGHVLPVQHPLRVIDEPADGVEPRLVAEHLADGDRLFSPLRELRPVLGDRVVVVEHAAVHERVEESGHHPLGGRERERHRALLPQLPLGVPRTGPDVDHLLAAVIDAHRRARARRVTTELLLEGVGHGAEVGVDVPLDHRHRVTF